MSYGLAATIVIVTVVFGGLLHAEIPHNDGDDHSGGSTESIVWGSLHGGLSHDDKKAFFVLVEYFEFLLIVTPVLVTLFISRQISLTADLLADDPVRGDRLRRGIARHRSFR